MSTKRYAAKHGPNLRNTLEAIANAQDFNAGNLWARNDTPGYVGSFGQLPSALVDLITTDRPAYIVFSYRTPIAWLTERDGREVMAIPNHNYSPTTSAHQSVVRRAAERYIENL